MNVLRIIIAQKELLLQQFRNALQELTHRTIDHFRLLIVYLVRQVAIVMPVLVPKIVLWVIIVPKELKIKTNIHAHLATTMTKQVHFQLWHVSLVVSEMHVLHQE